MLRISASAVAVVAADRLLADRRSSSGLPGRLSRSPTTGRWNPATARLIAIGLVVGVLAAVGGLSSGCAPTGPATGWWPRSSQQAAGEPGRPSAEARAAARAVRARRSPRSSEQRRSGHSLYELPWYVIIGAPGIGQDDGAGQLRPEVPARAAGPARARCAASAARATATGGSPTRRCFLDTAGRYTTQDSDAAADSAGWSEFLALLRKYRQRRPINGVILTISAQDLMAQSARRAEAHVEAARRRLDELNRELQIQLPVYLMVTKCDLVAGFTEYFDDLPQDGRGAGLGRDLPLRADAASGEAAAAFPAGVRRADHPAQRAGVRPGRGGPRRRGAARRSSRFPQQMAALRGRARPQFVERRLRLDAVRPAGAAARRLLHQRHAGGHADRPPARRDRPPLRRRRRSGGAAAGPRQGLLRRARC